MRFAELRLEAQSAIIHTSIRGDIDTSNADALREELYAMTPNDALGLIVDLSEVEYVDSAGIHLIHRLRDDLQARAQKLALVIPDGSLIHDTLRLAGVDWREATFESVGAAREALSPAQPA
jgi:anti-anti-sigma factor